MTDLQPASLAEADVNDRKRTRIQARNEKRILDAAEQIFAEAGFRGATIDMIAEAAAISKPNLHYYFKTKNLLYVAVLRRILDDWVAPLRMLDVNGDAAQELEHYIREKIEMSRKAPLASRVFANEILHGAPVLHTYLKTELRQVVEQKAAVIRTWIEQGQLRPVDPVHLIFMIWAATQHYADFQSQVTAIMRVRRLGRKHFQDIGDSIVTIILGGVLAKRP
ncbi:TetR family transcriptional regulator C-terminal domain-containing protein [Sphingopyxis sp. SE2]|uniref:TetR family transcriptional regulator C-terminal domain-containing protein n=1 Tax=Sphingopyxis sp. SE2 TaxID=1586240 RepID=UPI0028C302D0|nr:TetR family transcriptional regulator C-terminal domain-containing protein [Sphingopyxis sp. SE2]MDT7531624.1 TetR family transcriptional regulator C-terminal domain-containing protein [Sphingopyxis sp. SE2]